MNVLSLFDGISCGQIALERVGIQVDKYYAAENDPSPIQVTQKNYPGTIQLGDVYEIDYSKLPLIDLLIGGSPCTYWSIAKKERETTSEGIGYELFMQYVKALKVLNPKYFLYENNNSIHKDIKDAISKELGIQPIMIDSSLVSGQQRKRLYWTNIPGVSVPEDKFIKFNEIIKSDRKWIPLLPWCMKEWGGIKKVNTLRSITSNKSFCLTTNKSHSKNYYLNEDRNMMTKLDADEAEALQTLPMGYTNCLCEGKRFKAIGNGWTVDVIAHIFKGLTSDKQNQKFFYAI